jgi:hypothetical protein
MTAIRFTAIALAAISLLFSTAPITYAQNVSKPIAKPTARFEYNGVGTHSCGVYMENLRGLNGETFKLLYQQWGAGFLAGTSNEGRGSNPHTDLETYTAWLDKWCADDPSSSVISGVIALGKRLSARK